MYPHSLQEAEIESLETRIGLLLEGTTGDVRSRWDALAEAEAAADTAGRSKSPSGTARTRSKSPGGTRTTGGASRVPLSAGGAEGQAAAGRVRAAADAALLEGELRDVIVQLQAEVSARGLCLCASVWHVRGCMSFGRLGSSPSRPPSKTSLLDSGRSSLSLSDSPPLPPCSCAPPRTKCAPLPLRCCC